MYKIDYTFDKISNEKEAYILGFIYSDGYVLDKPFYRIGITISSKDDQILKEISEYISKEIPLKYESKIGIHNKPYNSVKLVISRKEVFENINKLGVLPRKTHENFNIPNIPKHLIRHFIRGYFDGDGGLTKDRKYFKFFIVSPSHKILEDFHKILKENGIYSIFYCDKRKGQFCEICNSKVTNYDQYRLLITKDLYIHKIYDFLYKDCTIKLNRKYEDFINYFKISKPKKSYNLEFLEYEGITKSLKEWAIEKNISIYTLKYRLYKAKWPLNEVFSTKLGEITDRHKKSVLKGINHPNCKLTEDQIKEVWYSKEKASLLAEKYNVHRDTIRKIRYGINFKSITDKLKNIII